MRENIPELCIRIVRKLRICEWRTVHFINNMVAWGLRATCVGMHHAKLTVRLRFQDYDTVQIILENTWRRTRLRRSIAYEEGQPTCAAKWTTRNYMSNYKVWPQLHARKYCRITHQDCTQARAIIIFNNIILFSHASSSHYNFNGNCTVILPKSKTEQSPNPELVTFFLENL